MSSVIPQYRKFKLDQHGFSPLSFDEFRKEVLPLKALRTWSDSQLEAVQALDQRGAGYALQRFLGAKHPLAVAALGAAERKPDPMTYEMLSEHLRKLKVSSRADGWERDDYTRFLMYLESGLNPRELARRNHEITRLRAEEASLRDRAAQPTVKEPDFDHISEKDEFATAFRSGSPAYQAVVRQFFMLAATEGSQ